MSALFTRIFLTQRVRVGEREREREREGERERRKKVSERARGFRQSPALTFSCAHKTELNEQQMIKPKDPTTVGDY